MKVTIVFMLVALSCFFATCAAFNLPQMDNLEPMEKYYYLRRMDICVEKYGAAMNTEAADRGFQLQCAVNAFFAVLKELSELLGCSIEEILLEMGISDMTLEEMQGVITGETPVNNLDPEQCEDFLIDLVKRIIDLMLCLLEGLLAPVSGILDGIIGPDGPFGDLLGGILGGEGGGLLGGLLGGEGGGLLGGVLGGEGGGLLGGLLGGEDGGLLGGILGGEGGGLLGGLLGGDDGGLLGGLLGGEKGGLLGDLLGGADGGLLGGLLGGDRGGLLGGILGGDGGLLGGLLGGGDKGKNEQYVEESGGVQDEYVKLVPVEETASGVDVSNGGIGSRFIGSNLQEGISSNFEEIIYDNDGSTFSGNTGQYVTGSMEEYGKGPVVVGSIGDQIGSYDTYIEQGALEGIEEAKGVAITEGIEGDETVEEVEEWVDVDVIEYSLIESEEESGEDDDNKNVARGAADDGITGGITGSMGGKKEGSAWGIIGSKGVGGSTFGGGIGELSGGAIKSKEGNSGWDVTRKTMSNEAVGVGAFGGITGGIKGVIGGKNGGSFGGIIGSKGSVSEGAAGSSVGEMKGGTFGSIQGGMGYEIKNRVGERVEGSLTEAVNKGVEGGEGEYTSGGLEGDFGEYEVTETTYTVTWEEDGTELEMEAKTE